MTEGNLLVVQAGGPTAVVNESLFGGLDAERRRGKSRKAYGSRKGLRGLIRNELVDLGRLTAKELDLVRRSPGAVLGSSRVKPTETEMEAVLDHLREREIHQAVFIGGNGTMHAARMISQFAK